tara:strand:+ start:151 stop:351 length:201 start_codon:yes stop_codon:yes gene_type:complete
MGSPVRGNVMKPEILNPARLQWFWCTVTTITLLLVPQITTPSLLSVQPRFVSSEETNLIKERKLDF